MLEVKNVTVSFGGLIAVKDMTMNVKKGIIHSLIGPNGAGKTTLFNVITRVIQPVKGSVSYEENSLMDLRPEQIIYKGISRTFQNLQLFSGMNVYDNILSGYIHNYDKNIFYLFSKNRSHFESEARERILEISELLQIKNRLSSYPASLSYGILKRVEIARAIVSNPKLLLFDEPAAGLNHNETSEIRDIMRLLKNQGKTILLVEHDMNLVMKISDRITVMSFGEKIAEGTPEEVGNNEEVIKVYLGESENA
ncbi:ABC transporter ATP-binding protein [Geotoga petraea]|jgi:branched-chain amino acid transport system ATP-binding protein|uniref:ABC transporter ATP-binding protein n=1 Tax=Geotoga petraea TaxID=28234 RepID=A0A1G6JTH4_9BACT|nr:ABC transporter ATP-binding protein [Geotoga petraea]TGG88295.1 ABC transporter ATP-binding protein [Geotoga petraea]SDC21306.1 amino acid/amide ABC transporter ATP-binding protein 1, HAAT family [Geotoga petraea]